MEKVVVLLSAYNGEAHIGEQIESILNQTWDNIILYIRDDGSTDNTINIIKKYEYTGKIILEKGDNIGYIDSFFWLLCNCPEADYYAYSDQDDVWIPEKIEMAVVKLEDNKEDMPVLYFSNYDFYDGELNFMARSDNKIKKPTFQNALVDCMPLGFNSVFNNSAREEMSRNIPKNCCGHDWWTYLVCQGLGKVIYDKRATVKYRRHGNNVSAGGMKFFEFQVWRFKKFFLRDYFAMVRKMLREYGDYYRDRLSEKDQKILRLFTKEKYNFFTSIQKVFYPHKYRQKFTDELMVRIIFLLGKL